MVRFLLLAPPALVLLFAATTYLAEAFALPTLTLGGGRGPLTLLAWVLEAVALCILYLLVQSRQRGGRFLDGLATGAVAWLFRGPLLVLSVAGVGRVGREPWWSMSRHQLVVYLLAGVLLGALARTANLSREG